MAQSPRGPVGAVEKQALGGFVLAIVVLIALAAGTFRSTAALIESNGLVDHTHEVLGALKGVEASLSMATSAQRGFLITNDQRFIVEQDRATSRLQRFLQALRELTKDNPRQQALLEQLEAQVGRRRITLDEALLRHQTDGFQSARDLLSDNDIPSADAELAATLARMESVERRLLHVRTAEDRQASDTLVAAFAALGIAVTLLLAVLGLRIRKDAAGRNQVDEALRRANAFLESIFENIPNMVFIKDVADLRFVRVNRAGEALLGLSREDLIGRSDYDFLPADEAQRFVGKDREALAGTGVTVVPEEAISVRGGEIRWLRTQKLAITEDGTPAFLLGISEDITDRKRAEDALRASQALLQSLFESLPGLYLILTPDLKIVTASDAYLNATMTRRERIVGRGLFDVFPDNPDDPQANGTSNLRESLDRVLKSGSADVMAIQKYDVRQPGGDFEARFWSPVNSPLLGVNGNVEYIIHRVEDVTDFVRQKAGLDTASPRWHARLEQMEAEVYQSAQKVQAANRQLQAANAELEAFSYSVSHDLRAPLRAIDGYAKALVEDCGAALDQTGVRYLERIQGAATRMGDLIDDMLSLAQITRAEMHKETVDVSALVDKVLRELGERDPARHIELNVEPGLTANADPRLLRLALENLLGNAWKFTRKTPAARIEVGHCIQDCRTVFHVRDNGAGFDPAYASKLFGAFQRLHKPSDFEGTGIGLATVQRIIARHGGQVWAEGRLHEGATFYFTLDGAESTA